MKVIGSLIALLVCFSSIGWAEISPNENRKTVTAAGTPEALSSTATSFSFLDICALSNNTGVIAVGGSGVIASLSTRTGVYLEAGDCYSIHLNPGKLGNLTSVYIDSTVSGEGVSFTGWKEI